MDRYRVSERRWSVYKDRAKVFDNEDGAPCDLWSEVFHGDGCAGGQSGILEGN